MKKLFLCACIVLSLFVFASCSMFDYLIPASVRHEKEYNDANIPTKPTYAPGGEPRIGMNAADVRNSSWGEPDKINTTETRYGINWQYVYNDENGFPEKYIYFENYIVTAISE